MMAILDPFGHSLSGASPRGLEAYDQALREMRCYIGDPLGSVDRALAECPEFTMAHVVRGYLHLLGTEPSGREVARASLERAEQLPADARERGHRAALRALCEGRWLDNGRALEDVALEHPRDLLALLVGHQIDFFSGRARMLRDRIARALPHWDESMPGYPSLLGMHAFGLEECGDYARAEERGRRAVELEPRDGWAWHAVAHVLEMQGRRADGIDWLRSGTDAWLPGSFFAVHLWWHLALFHLDRGEVDEALALFDGPIHGARSQVVLELIDASAMLWRLQLLGVDVRERWQSVADAWAAVGGEGQYAFNDAHAMMAFAGAGRVEAADAILSGQERALERADDNAMFTRDVGARVASALHAFGERRYDETVRLLRPVREIAQRFGGSHAQRDVIDRTLLEAARRAGQHALVRGLEAERHDLRPDRSARGSLDAWIRGAETSLAVDRSDLLAATR